MAKITKIFAKSEEKYVKSVILYADSDKYLCYDAAGTSKVTKDELADLFKKGIIISDTDLFVPVKFDNETTYTTVSCLAMSAGQSPAMGFVVYYSKEYTA